jgi:hypothetical protein
MSSEFWSWLFRHPQSDLVLLVLLGATAVECLVAIWAAESRRHWFVRALAVVAAIVLLVPIQAYEAVWLFALSSPLIVVALWWIRWSQNYPESGERVADGREERDCRWQFHIRDLLMLTVLLAISLAGFSPAFRYFQPWNYAGWIVSVLTVASIAVLAQFLVTGPRRWAAGLVLLLVLPIAASVKRLAVSDWTMGAWWHLGVSVRPDLLAADLGKLTVSGIGLAVLLITFLILARSSFAATGPLRRALSQSLLMSALFALLVPLGFTYLRLLIRSPQVPKLVVQNNQYARIVAIAERVSSLNPGANALADGGPTASEVTGLYIELRSLLAGTNAVDYDPERIEDAWESGPLNSLRQLARCLEAESRALMAQGQTTPAVEHALAAVQIGAMLQRGGTSNAVLTGTGIELRGYSQLTELRGDLSPDEMARVQAVLAKICSEREPHEDLQARELAYHDRCPLMWRLENWAAECAGVLHVIPVHGFDRRIISLVCASKWPALEMALQRCEVTHQLLHADLAIRQFQQERGELPTDLSDLVPGYLSRMPMDPHSGRALNYRATGATYALYSVGWDRQDDGGQFADLATYEDRNRIGERGLDLDLDTLTRP